MPEGKALTPELFFEFMRARNSVGACPFCATSAWSLSSDNFATASVLNTPAASSTTALQTYAVVCKNCGFVRHHHREAVDDWLNSFVGEAQDIE